MTECPWKTPASPRPTCRSWRKHPCDSLNGREVPVLFHLWWNLPEIYPLGCQRKLFPVGCCWLSCSAEAGHWGSRMWRKGPKDSAIKLPDGPEKWWGRVPAAECSQLCTAGAGNWRIYKHRRSWETATREPGEGLRAGRSFWLLSAALPCPTGKGSEEGKVLVGVACYEWADLC